MQEVSQKYRGQTEGALGLSRENGRSPTSVALSGAVVSRIHLSLNLPLHGV